MRSRSPSGESVEATTDNGMDVRVMRGTLPQSVRDEFRLHPRAVWEVLRGKHDVHVLSGLYTSPTFLLCAITAVLFRRPFVLWLERPHAPRRSRNGFRWMADVVKRRYLDWLLRRASQVWCIGSQAAREYQAIGVESDAVRVLPYCCQSERFQIDAAEAEAFRDRHEIRDKFVFLFSGQLIHRKGVDVLLAAFAEVVSRQRDAVLLILGDGPGRGEYENQALRLGVESSVRFLGHRPQSELPLWFAAADVFVFPSRHDGWAVVVNEACAASLPVIASTQTGAVHDLVEDGASGFMLDCEDVGAWTDRMNWCIEHHDELPAMGAASRRRLEPFTIQAGAARMEKFAREVIQTETLKQGTRESS